MSLRILFATHAPADVKTAVYRSVAQQARHLQAEGHHVDLLTRGDLASPAWARLDPIVLPILLATRDLSRYDVVVFHSYLGWVFHLLRRWFDPGRRVKTLTWFHGLEPLYHRAVSEEYQRTNRAISRRFRLLHHTVLPRLLKQSCRRSDAVLCFNSIEADYLAKHGWAESDRIHRVTNGVEGDCFLSRRHRSAARRLLFVGQWLPAKGTRYLVEAFTALAAIGDFELACVGTGASVEAIQQEFPAVVRSRVSVLPRVDREQLYEQLRLADLFIFPTLSEGFSCALLEAMAAELPVVTTPVGAAVDFIETGRNGVSVPCGDMTALVAAVVRMAGDVQTRTALGTAARQTALRYTVAASCVDFAARIHDVVGRSDNARQPGALEHPDAA
jgi:glycosyltransferase involved in cell wall biosynthesis